MYLQNNNKKMCSGCTACENICPKNAIKMIEDLEGFKYPVIEKDKCTNCKLCENVCPSIKNYEENNISHAYGIKHKNEEERKTSRSGAVFMAIADYILNKKGIVYGAILDEKFNVLHARAENKEDVNKFKGSKYTQSELKGVLKKVKEDLLNDKYVLFSGTACQVAAVKEYLKNIDYTKLFTCDLICHGTPSPMIYKDFLNYMENKYNSKIVKFNFRNKEHGWSGHVETTTFEDGTEITTNYFRNLFYGHHILRPACYNCNFANTHRPADITIADFWGVDKIAPEFYDEKGISLVYLNNEKGKEIFENIKENLEYIECNKDICIEATYTLHNPTPESENREEFWLDYKSQSFENIIEKYATKK